MPLSWLTFPPTPTPQPQRPAVRASLLADLSSDPNPQPQRPAVPYREDDDGDSSEEDISDETILKRHEERLKEIWARSVAAAGSRVEP